MIRSMTGYAGAERAENGFAVMVEARSHNNRFLDVVARLPQGYAGLEEQVRALVAGRLTRGRVEVRLQVQDVSETAAAFEIDTVRADSYHRALAQLRGRFNLPDHISLAQLSAVGGIIRPVEQQRDAGALWPLVEACVNAALDGLNAMRDREGAFIAEDLKSRLGHIEAFLDQIEAESEGLPDHYRDRLKQRIEALTQGMVEIDPGRIAQEAAFLADRADISEEIVRARSHLAQFRALMSAGEAEGRKLNFLLQEFNREFNTMGSKTGSAAVSHLVVAAKSELEKIREQIQNVE